MAKEAMIARESSVEPLNAVAQGRTIVRGGALKDPNNIPSFSRETREDREAYNKVITKYKEGDVVRKNAQDQLVVYRINRFTNEVSLAVRGLDGGYLPGARTASIPAKDFVKRYMK